MASIQVKDDTYRRLARRAADQKTTVDDLVEPVLDKLAGPTTAMEPVPFISPEERHKAFDEWMALIQQRADRYPPGFVADDSRESIYDGRGE